MDTLSQNHIKPSSTSAGPQKMPGSEFSAETIVDVVDGWLAAGSQQVRANPLAVLASAFVVGMGLGWILRR